jgi:hypothetical protein
VLRHADEVKGQAASGSNREGASTEAGRRGGAARSSLEGTVMGLERRGCVGAPARCASRCTSFRSDAGNRIHHDAAASAFISLGDAALVKAQAFGVPLYQALNCARGTVNLAAAD